MFSVYNLENKQELQRRARLRFTRSSLLSVNAPEHIFYLLFYLKPDSTVKSQTDG